MPLRLVLLVSLAVLPSLASLMPEVALAAPVTRRYALTDDVPALPPLREPLPAGAHHVGLEECFAFQNACTVIQRSGLLAFTTDRALGTAHFDASGVSALPLPIAAPIGDGSLAIALFRELEDVTGSLIPSVIPFDVWEFVLSNDARIRVTDLGATTIEIQGGYDLGPVDGPSAWITLEGTIVPEPSTATLVGLGLVGLATGRRGRA